MSRTPWGFLFLCDGSRTYREKRVYMSAAFTRANRVCSNIHHRNNITCAQRSHNHKISCSDHLLLRVRARSHLDINICVCAYFIYLNCVIGQNNNKKKKPNHLWSFFITRVHLSKLGANNNQKNARIYVFIYKKKTIICLSRQISTEPRVLTFIARRTEIEFAKTNLCLSRKKMYIYIVIYLNERLCARMCDLSFDDFSPIDSASSMLCASAIYARICTRPMES